ncbi:universal stress protein, partial [Corallococcus interemptor]
MVGPGARFAVKHPTGPCAPALTAARGVPNRRAEERRHPEARPGPGPVRPHPPG